MVGSAIHRLLESRGFENIITRTSKELDLRNQHAVHDFFGYEKPDYVFLAAAKVGVIHANNTYHAKFLYDNLMMETQHKPAGRITKNLQKLHRPARISLRNICNTYYLLLIT